MHLISSKKIKFFVPAILWTFLTIYLSANSIPLPDTGFVISDKFGHLVFYGIFAFWILWAVKKSFHTISKKALILTAIFCISFGVLMEFMQYAYFPDRYFEYYDMLANTIGVLITIILTIFFNKYYNQYG